MNTKKIITVDIGNTTINFGWFSGWRLIKTKKIATKTATKKKIKTILNNTSIYPVGISSVVPEANKLFKSLPQKVYFAGKNLKVPIKSLYDSKCVGMDRLVGAWTAKKIFPQTRLVLDFGTAVTLDFISKKGVYQGGIIMPGIGSTQKVLSACALLPEKITYQEPKRIIPKNTIESISAGIGKGFPFMINGLITKYSKLLNLPGSTPVIITGGEAAIIIKHLKFNYICEPFLVLKGLNLLLNRS
jgi:type III pantothenate kinase